MSDAEVLLTYREVKSWTKTGRIHFYSVAQIKRIVARASRAERSR